MNQNEPHKVNVEPLKPIKTDTTSDTKTDDQIDAEFQKEIEAIGIRLEIKQKEGVVKNYNIDSVNKQVRITLIGEGEQIINISPNKGLDSIKQILDNIAMLSEFLIFSNNYNAEAVILYKNMEGIISTYSPNTAKSYDTSSDDFFISNDRIFRIVNNNLEAVENKDGTPMVMTDEMLANVEQTVEEIQKNCDLTGTDGKADSIEGGLREGTDEI